VSFGQFTLISFPSTAREFNPADCFLIYLKVHTNHGHRPELPARQKLAITIIWTNIEQMSSMMLLYPTDLAFLGIISLRGFPYRLWRTLLIRTLHRAFIPSIHALPCRLPHSLHLAAHLYDTVRYLSIVSSQNISVLYATMHDIVHTPWWLSPNWWHWTDPLSRSPSAFYMHIEGVINLFLSLAGCCSPKESLGCACYPLPLTYITTWRRLQTFPFFLYPFVYSMIARVPRKWQDNTLGRSTCSRCMVNNERQSLTSQWQHLIQYPGQGT
jgi:hypothetical protein